jgi:hypothetical protein
MIKLESFLIKGTKKIIPKINKILSKTLVKLAEILNPFSSQFFFFFNLALLGFPSKIFAEFFNN